MKQIITQNLIRLAYQETEAIETLQLIEAVENNPGLKEDFEEIKGVQKSLNELSYSPSDASIAFILNYSERRGVLGVAS